MSIQSAKMVDSQGNTIIVLTVGETSWYLKSLYDQESDSILARLVCPDTNTVRELKVNLRPIKEQVLEVLSNKVGWGWSDLKAVASKVVKKVGAKKLLKSVKSIVESPMFEKGMGIASTIFPPLGISYGAVKGAANLIDSVRKGDPDAQQKMIDIVALAKEGDPAAAKAVVALKAIYGATKTEQSAIGWAESVIVGKKGSYYEIGSKLVR